ncbi:MAG TPA: winged helix DNA-binding protein [Gammaproteobacteria bacterium]|nr:winged helix DNA-binding protein [Gammaproteobacteria bacterium]
MEVTAGRSWHLAQDESETEVTNFELQLWRVFYGFVRWQEECEKSTNDTNLTGHELAVLHVVRMKDKPKTISDIGRILNRNDMFNINYSLRKLMQKGLVKKSRSGKGVKAFFYEITAKGIEDTDAWSKMRRDVLISAFMKDKTIPLKEMANNLMKIKSIYDEADSIVAYTSLEKTDENEIPKKIKKK